MLLEKVLLTPKVVELSSKSPNTNEIVMLVHTIDRPNGNGLTFTMDSTEKYKDTLVDKPVVVRTNVEETDFTGHQPLYDSHGNIIKLDTIPIGVITETWIEDYRVNSIETVKALMARAKIWSYKFPTVFEIMNNFFNEGSLETSVEVAVYSLTSDSTERDRKTDQIEYLANCILGKSFQPADSLAGIKEIATALHKDMKLVGGATMTKRLTPEVSINELSFNDIRQQLYSLIETNGRLVWIVDIFQTYCVYEDWENSNLYKREYTIEGNTVQLTSDEVQVKIEYVPVAEGEEVVASQFMSDHKENVEKIKNLESELSSKDEKIEELNSSVTAKEEEVTKLSEKITEKENAINELTSTIANKEEEVTKLNSQMDELKTYKEKFETEQLNKEIAELRAKYVKLLSKEKFESEEVQKLINDREVSKLNDLVVSELAEKSASKEPKEDDVLINSLTLDFDQLLDEDLRSKYLS